MPKKENTRDLLLKLFHVLWDKDAHQGAWPIRFWRGDFWQWNQKHYCKITENDVGTLLQSALVESKFGIDPAQIRRLIEVAKWEVSVPDSENMPLMIVDQDLYQSRPNWFALQNLILNLDTSGLSPSSALHTPLFFSDQCVDYPYNPKAECPRWRSFLDEVLPDPLLQDILQRWFGYVIRHDTTHQKFLLVHGPSATGKSVMASILRELVGKDACSAVPLKAFGSEFALYQTLGKKVNIDPDMSELDKVDEGALKSWVGNDLIRLNRKYRDPIDTYPTARLVFCTNDLPYISDKSDATWRRMILLPFNVVIPSDKQDKNLLAKLKSELSGIFNWALEGCRTLSDRMCFPEAPAVQKAIEEYKVEVSPVRQWVNEMCVLGGEDTISCKDAYEMFVAYALARGYRSPAQRSFGRSLAAAAGDSVKRVQKRDGPNRAWYYQGLYARPEKTQG
jgi:putative DNA primase/helicase